MSDDEDLAYRSIADMANRAGDVGIFELEPFDHDDRVELTERIFDLYQDAYIANSSIDASTFDRVDALARNQTGAELSQIRTLIKRYVTELDRQFGPPEA